MARTRPGARDRTRRGVRRQGWMHAIMGSTGDDTRKGTGMGTSARDKGEHGRWHARDEGAEEWTRPGRVERTRQGKGLHARRGP
jgi:hypothetical protein